MKTKSTTPFIGLFSQGDGRLVTNLVGAAVLTGALLLSYAAHGITMTWKAANTEVYFGLPFDSLEFENPLTGTEMVMSHKVLDWRDADYGKPGFPLYDDWSVSSATITGNINEIYMWSQGDSIWTTTTVPSTIVSIHLNGDDNDGLSEVLVDGVDVAQFDMWTSPCCETALIIVKGLPNTTHTITVLDLGFGVGGTDVHTMGAAALAESGLKWNQQPVPVQTPPTNVFYGWNQRSVEYPFWGVAADDWVCTSTNPVTKIRWWGSFAHWLSNAPPPFVPDSYQITIYHDMPANVDTWYSHPDGVAWQFTCTNFSTKFVGWDYNPRNGDMETCFLFEQTLTPDQYFTQPDGSGTVYWLSIGAIYSPGTAGPWPWGWKTRPRDLTSPAPDDAVISTNDVLVPWAPLYWPYETNSWDLAFELLSSSSGGMSSKYEQIPDLFSGIDVRATTNRTSGSAGYLLADDFPCTSPTYITNITIWGSWSNNFVPGVGLAATNVMFTLSIHDNIPPGTPPCNKSYSMPGAVRWTKTFTITNFTWSIYATNFPEAWLTPPNTFVPNCDTNCYQYNFNIPINQAFLQEGTPSGPKVYWLDVQAITPGPPPNFGWKTCPTNWNDNAVWVRGSELYNGCWTNLTYPRPLDLAFRLNGCSQQTEPVKWSQRPVPIAQVATNNPFYNGWNQDSTQPNMVADDWACTNANPVTDIHWWGSFANWYESDPPPLPDGFQILIWNDVPKGMDAAYSHPGSVIWQTFCTNFSCQFAGLDVDPRNPNALFEPCFEFTQDLTTNDWFRQPTADQVTNIYWVSISAVYHNGSSNPFGWKARPRDPNSLAPDDSVTNSFFAPGWGPIWWPSPANSWDMAFDLTTIPQSTNNCVVMLCPADMQFSCTPSNGTFVYYTAYASNWCSGTLTPVDGVPPSGSLFGPGTTQVCCTNITPPWTNSCCFLVTVLPDTNPPTLTCPANILGNTDPGKCSKSNVVFVATGSDDCPGLTVICSPPSGSTFAKGTNTVICTATDIGGNKMSGSFTVAIRDLELPVVSCSTNIVATTDPGLCSKANVAWVASASDNCLVTNLVCNPPSGSTFAKGTNTVICTATDSSGNSSSCSFTVTILDRELPQVACATNIVANTDPGQCSRTNVTFTATASDNCPGVTVACVPPSGSPFAKGTNTVICTAIDSSGHSNSCSFTVAILDKEPPHVTCPTNIIATVDPGQSYKANVTWTATATDNCPGVTVSCNPPSGSTFWVGTNAVTCTAVDSSGNSNNCAFTVTICWPKPTTNIVITNLVFTSKFNGWNEPSVEGLTTIAADDWVCTTTNPVTNIRWWGSFLGWQSDTPPVLPPMFHIAFWSDVPAGLDGLFSHPGQLQLDLYSPDYTWQFAGWDVDPRTLEYEACFRFDQKLAAGTWFYQTNRFSGTNIYWLSIAALYPQGPQPQFAWGWKTRPRATNSPAPDDAVRFTFPQGPYQPIYWPEFTNSWDLAFELTSDYTNLGPSKWYQPPDLSTNGIDVNASTNWNDVLADDFLCTSPGPLTNITIWGSWFQDQHYQGFGPANIVFTLSIHSDLPAGTIEPYSEPGSRLWARTFLPGQYNCTVFASNLQEGWLDPPGGYYPPPFGDYTCYQYDFNIPAAQAFVQQGTPSGPIVYWLNVEADIPTNGPPQGVYSGNRFGWKTSTKHWNDAAAWSIYAELDPLHNAPGYWAGPLIYPIGHPWVSSNIDLAFRLNGSGGSQHITQLKWSQPPVTNRYVTVEWKPENNIHYQLQATTYLSNAPLHALWTNVGPEVIGPVHQQNDTNASAPQRFYRVVAPFVDP